MLPPALAGVAMTADEARARAAHYRALAQRTIDEVIRETLLNLVTIYETYVARLDKEAFDEFPKPAA